MSEKNSGSEYLEMLRRESGAKKNSFNRFADYMEAKARKYGIPIDGQFELLPLCNLNCGMCYVHLTPGQMGERPLLTADQWEDLFRQAVEAGMFQATLTGGECLLHPDFERLYLYLHSLGCQVNVLTNGVLLDEEKLSFFKEHPPAQLQITLYGNSEETYERVTGRRVFQTVVNHLRRIREEGLPLLITITPNQALGEDVFETIRLAKSITDNYFINTSLFDPPDEPWRQNVASEPDVSYYARILRFQKELNGRAVGKRPESELPPAGGPCRTCGKQGLQCGGGRSGFVINWKGEMKICNRLGPKSDPLRGGLAAAWKEIHAAAESWPRASECDGCAYEGICGICAADALKYAEPGKQPKGLCERTRYLASQGVVAPSCPE